MKKTQFISKIFSYTMRFSYSSFHTYNLVSLLNLLKDMAHISWEISDRYETFHAFELSVSYLSSCLFLSRVAHTVCSVEWTSTATCIATDGYQQLTPAWQVLGNCHIHTHYGGGTRLRTGSFGAG